MSTIQTEDLIMYMNGEFIRYGDARLNLHDRGFIYGDAAYDIARTYGHKAPRLREHIHRLYQSLEYLRIQLTLTENEMHEVALNVVERNLPALGPDDDFRIVLRVSRGVGDSWNKISDPTVLIYCLPMNYAGFAKKYVEGAHVVVTSVRRTPPESLDPRAKLHQKLNHIMAELEARAIDPGAYALMLDTRGFLAECSAQNIFLVKNGELLTPQKQYVLDGITRRSVLKAAEVLGIPSKETDLTYFDLMTADEVFVTANSIAIMPVNKINNQPLKNPVVPGPITKQLQDEFGRAIGFDVVGKAIQAIQ